MTRAEFWRILEVVYLWNHKGQSCIRHLIVSVLLPIKVMEPTFVNVQGCALMKARESPCLLWRAFSCGRVAAGVFLRLTTALGCLLGQVNVSCHLRVPRRIRDGQVLWV